MLPVQRNSNLKWRILAVLFVLVLGFGGLAARIYHIQVNRHEELFEKAKGKYIRSVTKFGQRGRIYDAKGGLFAGDNPYWVLQADPLNFPLENQDCPHVKPFQDKRACKDCPRSKTAIRAAAGFLSYHLGLDRAKLIRDLSQTKRTVIRNGVEVEEPIRYVLVAKKIGYEDGKKLKERMREHIQESQKRLSDPSARAKIDYSRAFSLQNHFVRNYPHGRMLSNVIGFVNTNYEKTAGISGLERSMDEQLKPINGRLAYERDPKGAAIGIPDGLYELEPPINGADIYLTVDEAIQNIVENELDAVVEKYRPKLAYAVVADPKTGRILAIAQRPTFDPNDRATFVDRNMQNLMSENIFEPGSTMKPLPVAFAIDRNIIDKNETIFCENGFWLYGGKPLRDTNKYGRIDVKKIIQVSSNIGTAKIALMCGNAALDECFRTYGFGSRTDLPMKPESRGIYLPLRRWNKLTPTRIVIGQGIAVTPFQMIRAYSALANNGFLPQLKLIDRYVTYDEHKNATIKYPDYKPAQQIFRNPESTTATIKSMMKAVCEPGGTARRGAIPGYWTAGKTGTAQKVINGRYSNSKHVASFAGFAPVDDPKFVMLVSVDEPQGNSYGGVVAAPVFAAAGEQILRYMNVKPDYEVGGPEDPFENRRRNHRPNTEDPNAIREISVANPFPILDPDEVGFTQRDPVENDYSLHGIFSPEELEYLRQTETGIHNTTSDPVSDLAPPIRFREAPAAR